MRLLSLYQTLREKKKQKKNDSNKHILYMLEQESRAIARKPRDAAAVRFGLKFKWRSKTDVIFAV